MAYDYHGAEIDYDGDDPFIAFYIEYAVREGLMHRGCSPDAEVKNILDALSADSRNDGTEEYARDFAECLEVWGTLDQCAMYLEQFIDDEALNCFGWKSGHQVFEDCTTAVGHYPWMTWSNDDNSCCFVAAPF